MPDVFSVGKRSEIMSRVKGRGNRATELRLIEIMRAHKIKGWRRRVKLFGSPDFVFRTERLAVFVDGCFWHGCPLHGQVPKSNRVFWQEKLARNQERDKRVSLHLQALGWKTLRIWQHDLSRPANVANRITRMLGGENRCGGVVGRLISLNDQAVPLSQSGRSRRNRESRTVAA